MQGDDGKISDGDRNGRREILPLLWQGEDEGMKYDDETLFFLARLLKYKAMEEGWAITEMLFEIPADMYDPTKSTLLGIRVIRGRTEYLRLMVAYDERNFARESEEKATANEILKKQRIADEIAEEICDHYCRFPREWDEEKEGISLAESDICRNCPIGKGNA